MSFVVPHAAVAVTNEIMKNEEFSSGPSFTFSEQEKAEFVSHMMNGVRLMIQPVESSVLDRTGEVLTNQEQLQEVVNSEEVRFEEAKTKIAEIQLIMTRVPQYKQKLLQVKKDMGSIQRRCSKLSAKSRQLEGSRDRMKQDQEREAARLAKLEARVVTTTPSDGIGGSGGGAKVAVVKD